MANKATSKSIIHTVNDIINMGRARGIIHLYTEDTMFNGRIIKIKGNNLINFGSCSYLGLEIDKRLKRGAIDAIERYGIQFSSSRSYVACTPYIEWESLIRKMFNAPVVLSTSVSIGHHAVIPVVVSENDVIILDQQAHASIQDAANKMQTHGVKLTIIRHNNLKELENKIIELSKKHDKVWYMADGVYSMYGDYAPIKELIHLLDKYKQFHLYIDDAHGMSIAGKNGTGFVLSKTALHKKMILATSLNKAYAAGGGAFILPDEELCQKIKNCGGPMIFSGPHQIPVIGAGIASAKIHLSDEIYERQAALKERLLFCHNLLEKYHLPVVSNPETPIFFIGLGLTRVGYNLVSRMMQDGFFVNLGVFPAVPESCSGIRFTITCHHTFEDIERLAASLAYHLPKALQEEGRTMKDIYRAFRHVCHFDENESEPILIKAPSKYKIQCETSIRNIPSGLWNAFLGNKGSFDHNALLLMEETFKNNEDPENNWRFYYYIIRDEAGKPVLATFFTLALVKDDLLAPASVSQKIELERLRDPYYLCSSVLMMGCPLTEGEHLYLDRTRTDWRDIMMLLLDTVWKQQEILNANVVNLRDFYADDEEMKNFLMDQGFIKYQMPDTHVLENTDWGVDADFLGNFNHSKRQYLKQKVFRYKDLFQTNIIREASPEQIKQCYTLYQNVSNKSFEVNTFCLPFKFFRNIAKNPNWEIIQLILKEINEPVAAMFCYKNDQRYCPAIVGLDYNYLHLNIYPQILWQTLKRANYLRINIVNLGLTASQNKRKFGAKCIPQVAYIQVKDNYNYSLINSIMNTTVDQESQRKLIEQRDKIIKGKNNIKNP